MSNNWPLNNVLPLSSSASSSELSHVPVWFRRFPALLQWSLAGGDELTIQSW